MSVTIGCPDAKLFERRMRDAVEQVHDEICEFMRQTDNIWLNDHAFKSSEWQDGTGYVKTRVRHFGAIAPQGGLSDWEAVRGPVDENEVPIDDEDWDPDLKNTECNYTCQELEVGLEEFSYSPKKSCILGPLVCAEDVRSDWKFFEVNTLHQNSFEIAASEHITNYHRDTYLSFARRYPAVEGFNALSPVVGALPSIQPGMVPLSIELLETMYQELAMLSWKYATGRGPEGQLIFSWAVDMFDLPLFLRRTYGTSYFDNTEMRGQIYLKGLHNPRMFGNWMFHATMMPRYIEDPDNAGELLRVYPYQQDDAANITGQKTGLNPLWENATYGEAALFMPDVFSNEIFRPLGSVGGISQTGGTAPNRVDWDGKPRWVIPHTTATCNNDDGLIGRAKFVWKRAAKPGCNDRPISLIYKRCEFGELIIKDCDAFACGDPCEETLPVFDCETGVNLLIITSSENLNLEVGDSATITTDGVDADRVLASVDFTEGFTYRFTMTDPTCGNGEGVTNVVKV